MFTWVKLEKKSLTGVFTNVSTKKPSMQKHEVQLKLFSHTQLQNLRYNKHKVKTKKLDKRKTKKFMNIYKQKNFKERCNVHLESNNSVDLRFVHCASQHCQMLTFKTPPHPAPPSPPFEQSTKLCTPNKQKKHIVGYSRSSVSKLILFFMFASVDSNHFVS
jgi:hypothetical protein